jgi:TRAP-type mannitol/chloroaromatic compound transport system substrate-binding protein
MKTRRRKVLVGAASAAASVGSLPAPALAEGVKQFTMATAWPENSPGYQGSAERLARSIAAMSDGRLKIRVYPANKLVAAFETFDALSAGVADMYHAGDDYFRSKVSALNFFSQVLFGITADERSTWIASGGREALYESSTPPSTSNRNRA